jgi:hypothetical protein
MDAERFVSHGEPRLRKKLRKSAFNLLESLARVILCADEIRSSPLPARLTKVAQWIGFALFKFGVARGSLEAFRLNGVIAHRAHSPCVTISAASGKGLRYTRELKHQCNRSNDDDVSRSFHEDWLRHHGFLFNSRQYQLLWRQTLR